MRTAPRRRALRPLVAGAAAALLLAACSSGTEGGTVDATPTSATGGGFPVTLENTYGETTVEEQPEAVASVAWGNHDVPLALGIVPVGMAAQTYGDDDGDGIHPWTYAALEELGATGDELPVLFDESDGIDFEAVSETVPDVVLAAYSGLSEEDWTTLSQIAPTVSFPEVAWGTSWRDMALVNGRALGREDEARAVVADVEQQIEDALAERPDVAGKSVAYLYVDPTDLSSIGVYTKIDARVQLLSDLGMTLPESVESFEDDGLFYVDLSAEQADQIADADMVAIYGDETLLPTLQAHPLWSKIPAIANGAVAVLPDNTPLASATSGPTVLSIPWALEDYLDLFQAAAQNVQ
ncbi:ABC transporter substrate-binding protein [Cellulomonas sp. JZ18]|uniref:iron-siderophore ABC transporter substrate-binding protein n=1 Tax=Cellulomonas sp. JZ18 TaxID=2654191 RepID=UPI0012D3DB9B|nr:iron-siderophore ABC transporter substrate-binding protein [Cellulomonas sp. JZ18]QGQ18716.1 ABC transporter substrate-binding protein [Cellulomonas sp. JZ18]